MARQILTTRHHAGYDRGVFKATVVILLSVVLGISAVMALRSGTKSLVVRGIIAGLAVILLAIVLRPEKDR
jgi:hypothetical protein